LNKELLFWFVASIIETPGETTTFSRQKRLKVLVGGLW